MAYLDAIESLLYERLEALAAAFTTRVRPYRNCSCRMRERYRVSDLEPRLRDESGPACSEETVESFLRIANVSTANHRARNVRPANGSAAGLSIHSVHLDVHAEALEFLDHSLGARLAITAELRELCIEQGRTLNVQREEVYFARAVVGAELDPAHYADTG
jgi:hypothetical protein